MVCHFDRFSPMQQTVQQMSGIELPLDRACKEAQRQRLYVLDGGEGAAGWACVVCHGPFAVAQGMIAAVGGTCFTRGWPAGVYLQYYLTYPFLSQHRPGPGVQGSKLFLLP